MDIKLRELERRAATGDLEAEEQLQAARRRTELQIPSDGLWLNAYIGGQAKATMIVYEVETFQQAYDRLEWYFNQSNGPYTHWEREVYDIHLQETVTERRGSLSIKLEDDPCFDFEKGRALNIATYDPYVSLHIIDEFPDPDAEPAELVIRHAETGTFYHAPTADWVVDVEEATRYTQSQADAQGDMFYTAEYVYYGDYLPRQCWMNVYQVTRHYGGAQEGGWYYNFSEPFACIDLGALKPVNLFAEHPEYVLILNEFLTGFYDYLQYGDMYSVRGGAELHVRVEDHPAQISGPPTWE